MIYTKLWERYFAKQFLGIFCALLFGFFALYVLLDYSSHTATFHKNHIRFEWHELILFYFWEFVRRIDVLIPFALLIATIKTLCQLNVNNELVAMLSSGVPIKSLLKPFFVLGCIFTALMYLNTQFLVPIAATHLKSISDESRKTRKNKQEQAFLEHIAMADESTIIFQRYDSEEQRFFDAYWVRSADDVYRIKYLYPHGGDTPRGEFVQHLQRNAQGAMVETSAQKEQTFTDMHFNKKKLIDSTILPEQLSLTTLWDKIGFSQNPPTEKQVQLLTTFYVRLAMPWLCLLVVIGPAPFCIRFSRTLPVFLIYAVAAFTFIALYLVMESAELMAKRQVFPPLAGIFLPLLLFSSPLIWNYCRLK